MKSKDIIIIEAIEKLKILTGEDFHGYRSEIWNVIEMSMKEQDRNTRHACAEAIILLHSEDFEGVSVIGKDIAHGTCINVRAI